MTDWTGGGLNAPQDVKDQKAGDCGIVLEATPDGFAEPAGLRRPTAASSTATRRTSLTLHGDYSKYGKGVKLCRRRQDARRPEVTERPGGAAAPPGRSEGIVDKFLTFTVVGLSTAAIYAVIASGLVLTYTTTGVFNFAHGAIGMLAAFTYWQLRVELALVDARSRSPSCCSCWRRCSACSSKPW